MDSFFAMIAVFAFIGMASILPLFTSSRRANVELNLKPLWQKRCAGKMGAIGIGIPSIRVALYQDFMVIAFLGQTIIPYQDIEEVSIKRAFWSLNFAGVLLKLRGMRADYRFNLNLSDSNEFVKVIESHLPHHSKKR